MRTIDPVRTAPRGSDQGYSVSNSSKCGLSAIRFVQGRYFLPLLPLVFVLLSNRRLAGVLCERQLTFVAACGGVLFAAIAMRYQILRWYGL